MLIALGIRFVGYAVHLDHDLAKASGRMFGVVVVGIGAVSVTAVADVVTAADAGAEAAIGIEPDTSVAAAAAA
jgi:hypothetical protein